MLKTGHFHAAAIFSAHLLTTLSSTVNTRLPPPRGVLALFYIRLATLTLINLTHYAAQESKALEDLTSSFYRDPVTNKHIVPWELRVLAVRLQAIGWGDWRRGIEGYYDLARECRAELRDLSAPRDGGEGRGEDTKSRQAIEGDLRPEEKQKQKELWKQRLQELGSRVADGLVEMGDLQGAARHLESLKDGGGGQAALGEKGAGRKEEEGRINTRLALLYLRIGRVDAARGCVASTRSSRLTV